MIKGKIADMQCRIQTLERFIGQLQNYKQKQLIQGKEKIGQIVGKMHKDVQRKFEKIKKGINNYGASIDTLPNQDKLNIVTEQIEELKQLAIELDKIQKLLPALNTQKYTTLKQQYNNIDLLFTTSQIQLSPINNQLSCSKYNPTSLSQLRNIHRRQINQLFQLNYRVISNLNNKLKTLNLVVQNLSQ